MSKDDLLKQYRLKRTFTLTPEPAEHGESLAKAAGAELSYVIQKHWASSLHYDFRLEFDGVLKSWAVPKGPSLDPHIKRMAVQVEDHPLSYASFEGTIPAKQYGAGKVIIWDRGTWLPLEDAANGFREGRLKFEIFGEKLRGKWMLVRMKGRDEKQPPWLLIKERDTATPSSKTSASVPTAAKRTALPFQIAPQLATLVDAPPAAGHWLYELKFDGYRIMARIDGDDVRCLTRNGHDWTDKMPQLVQSLRAWGLESAWLDGEIIVPDPQGIPNFQLLQNAFDASGEAASAPHAAALVYYLFDLPFSAHHDLRDVALVERRAQLQQLMQSNTADNLKFSETFDHAPQDLFASACKLGFEGLIGKRADAPYQSGRSLAWIKLKCGQRQEFVICGFTDPKGSRTGLGALLLGVHDAQGGLQYAGNVGTGFNEKLLVELRGKLNKLEVGSSPFASQAVIVGKPHWVTPSLLAEISFASWTASSRVRHAVFRGLRTDKPPQAITRDEAMTPVTLKKSIKGAVKKPPDTASPPTSPLPAALRVTHAERVIDQQSGITKLDLVQYYALAAPLMLPHLTGRPVSLVRVPSGVGGAVFFQKHANDGEVPGITLLDRALDPGHMPLLEIHTVDALLSAAQMNTIEFHTWNATAQSIEKPDRMTFDLDPGDNLAWPRMQEAAVLVKTMLETLGLAAFLKTSGGKGLHVVVPLKKQHGWEAVKEFSHHVVSHLGKTLPQIFVAKSGPKNRMGKIFVDYLRNGFGATTACAWTARARPGMGVSVPVGWGELPSLRSGAHWTVQNVADRLKVGNTPWDGYEKAAQRLGPAMKALDFKPIAKVAASKA